MSRAQIRTLAFCAGRQLAWGQRQSSRIIARWKKRAEAIPDEPLRRAAVSSLTTKRGHADGAALFSVLVARKPRLLELLLAFEIIWDYLDSAHELAPDEANGRQLHLALVEAVDLDQPRIDHYRYSPWREDGGYLRALVHTCRASIAAMPSYGQVWPFLRPHVQQTDVLALNHLRGPAERDASLRRWAHRNFGDAGELGWFELSGAASASVVPHALLTMAAMPRCSEDLAAAVCGAYWPWVALATTMLDSYVDQAEDASTGNHSYIGHYGSSSMAASRVAHSIRRSAQAALALPDGHRHAVIVACMVAMYLSKDSAWAPELRPTTRRLLGAGGSLTQALAPVLRAWRLYYGHRAA